MGIVIGDLRYVITIQSLTVTRGAYKEAVETYTDLTQIRAGVKFNSGTNTVDNKEKFHTQTVQFTTYYRSSIIPTCRIVFDEKKYRILSIAEVGYREGMVITAELINE